jgi:hypothetical protein
MIREVLSDRGFTRLQQPGRGAISKHDVPLPIVDCDQIGILCEERVELLLALFQPSERGIRSFDRWEKDTQQYDGDAHELAHKPDEDRRDEQPIVVNEARGANMNSVVETCEQGEAIVHDIRIRSRIRGIAFDAAGGVLVTKIRATERREAVRPDRTYA